MNFKKITAIGTSVLIAGMTMGLAAAATYPAPFVQNGAGNFAVVYGTGAGVSATDLVSATALSEALADKVVSGAASADFEGEAASLASGSNKIYLSDAINSEVSTLTSDVLPTVLASGTFEDDDGTDYDYDQTIVMGSRTFTFSDSGSDLDDPALIVDLGTDTSSPVYTSTVTFAQAVNFTDADSKGQDIELFGKSYTVGSSTTATVLQLLGAGKELTLSSTANSETVTLGDSTYTVTINNANTGGTEISVTVNGETKTVTEGSTKKISGISIYAKDVMAAVGDTWQATIQVGADELYLEDEKEVKVGSDQEAIEGTKVNIVGGVDAMTKLEIAAAPEDNDFDHIAVGEAFEDPVFGTFKLAFTDVVNGPTIEAKGVDSNAERHLVEFKRASDDSVAVKLSVKGNSATIEFADETDLEDDDSHDIEVVEGAQLQEDEYYILNSGAYQRMVQVTYISADDDDAADDDVTLKDVFSGQEFKLTDKDLDTSTAVDWSIDGQTYKVKYSASNKVTITSSDFATKAYVYPYLETLNGKDTRFAFTDEVALGEVLTTVTNNVAVESKIYQFPTGEIQFRIADSNVAATADDDTTEYSVDGGSWTALSADAAIAIGEVVYDFDITLSNAGNADTLTLVDVAVDGGQDTGDANDGLTSPAFLFVEEEDNSDSDAKNAVIIPTKDGTYTEIDVANIVFTATEVAGQTFDNTDYQGNIDQFGVFVVEDTSDDNQAFATLTYPEEQMYADLYVAESDAVEAETGAILVKDSEVASVATKNLIVVGGSCINSAAATLIGGAKCGDAWTAATEAGAGKFVIKSYADNALTSELAVLVAGYEVADTANAVSYFQNKVTDTSKNYLGTSAISATVVA